MLSITGSRCHGMRIGRQRRVGAPEDWPGRVYHWLNEQENGTVDVIGQPGGGGPTDQQYRVALRALKLSEPKYLQVRRLALREVWRPGFTAPFYRDIRVRRYNPEYPW